MANISSYGSKRVYGRRQGRPLSESRQAALDALAAFDIPLELICEDGRLSLDSLFEARPARAVLEIGFGNGEHVKALLDADKDAQGDGQTGFIAVEPFLNGMSAFLKSLEGARPANLRLLMDDAVMLARSLEDACLDEIYILNPDPWHKARHHKRRIVRADTLPAYHRILKPGGRLILTTDVPDLAEWMLTHTLNHGGFHWTAQSCRDWQTPPPGWHPTRYETKRAKGAAKMVYMVFEKV